MLGQAQSQTERQRQPPTTQATTPPPQPGTPATDPEARKQIAEQQVKQQEHQRILGIFPNFNTSNVPDAVPLTPKQKFRLTLASILDPVTFAVAGADAGVSQWEDSFKGYGLGAQGYGKRLGASYADTADGALIGNALLPSLLHQDPRYFRKGTGSFMSRLGYAISTTVICKGDNGHWEPNISNIGGNFIAGGISNIYYPSTDRGASLTIDRALTVTAEGSLGAIADEFWPDVSRRISKKRNNK